VDLIQQARQRAFQAVNTELLDLYWCRCKRVEEREFYLRLTTTEKWSSRELERQLSGALFERAILSPPKVSAALRELHPTAETIFKDTYLLDFLDLPDGHSEADLQGALVANLRRFLLELGRDFSYHRELQCLVAFELKIDEFQPGYLGQLDFYLEALDRDVRKPHERPSIGVLLCATTER
jgi:predicted nuclease of restriction endonuclease-like (RecB) superfamily